MYKTDSDNNKTVQPSEAREAPRIVLCDLGEMDWVKVKEDFILVNCRYAAKIKANRGG